MKLLNTLNRRFGRYAIPNLTLILLFFQILTFIMGNLRKEFLERIAFVPQLVVEGEGWRLLTFLAYPPVASTIFVLFFFYAFYLFGSALEATWGAFNYNVYLLLGYLATVGVAFLAPDQPASNGFLYASIFLAFAYLYPDFIIYVMFVFPVKIKWLALIMWISYGAFMLRSDWKTCLIVAASFCNFLIFFGKDIVDRARMGRRRMAQQARKITDREVRDKPRHECSVCKATNVTHPSLRFRYCSKCPGTPCFCEEHLKTHQHEENQAAATTESQQPETSQ